MSKVMVRVLVVAFVVIDVALGVLAWRHVYGGPDVAMTSPAPTPTSSVAAPAGWAPLDPAAAAVMDGAVGGTVVVASSGACDGDAATVVASTDGGTVFKPIKPDVQRVLAVDVEPTGDIHLIGTDDECAVVGLASTDQGATWDTGPVAVDWYRDPRRTTAVVVKGTSVDAGCPVITLSGVAAEIAEVSCADGSLRRTEDGGAKWATSDGISGVRAVSFVSSTNGTALVQTEKCGAAVFTTTNGGGAWAERGCVEGAFAGAVLDIGSVINAWVDATLWTSADGGTTWTRPDTAAEPSKGQDPATAGAPDEPSDPAETANE